MPMSSSNEIMSSVQQHVVPRALVLDRVGGTRAEAQCLGRLRHLRPLPVLGIDREIVGDGYRVVLDHGAPADHGREVKRVVEIRVAHAPEEIAAVLAQEIEIL